MTLLTVHSSSIVFDPLPLLHPNPSGCRGQNKRIFRESCSIVAAEQWTPSGFKTKFRILCCNYRRIRIVVIVLSSKRKPTWQKCLVEQVGFLNESPCLNRSKQLWPRSFFFVYGFISMLHSQSPMKNSWITFSAGMIAFWARTSISKYIFDLDLWSAKTFQRAAREDIFFCLSLQNNSHVEYIVLMLYVSVALLKAKKRIVWGGNHSNKYLSTQKYSMRIHLLTRYRRVFEIVSMWSPAHKLELSSFSEWKPAVNSPRGVSCSLLSRFYSSNW